MTTSTAATASSKKGAVKDISPLRQSCDSCRFRKTKCDMRKRLETGNNGCSFCKSMGLVCSITPTITSRRSMPRLGKRMKVLLNDNRALKSADQELQSTARVSPPSLSRSTSSQDKGKGLEPRNISAVTPFLGVQGLNRAKLDVCIDAFFKRLGPCMPLSQSLALFWPRYQLFLDVACGASDKVYMGIEPASELLVLAVACRGCGNTDQLDKNELLEAISDRFVQLANTAEGDSLLTLDGIEAVNLISERVVRPLYSQSTTVSPLHMDILGRSSSTELALLSNLHIPPPDNSEERERFGFVFWTIFVHDAFRSVAARRMYRIHEEDIGWIPPDQIVRTGPYPYYGKAMYRLSLVARRISRDLLSVRAKRQGLSRSTLIDTIARLNSWHEELDEPLKFKWTHPDGSPFTSYEDNPEGGIDLPAKRSFMLTIWLSLYLQVWASLPTRTSIEMSDQDSHLESEILQAYFRMASIARYCQNNDLVDCAPNELRNVPAAWALWYACYIRRAAGLYINIAAQRIDQLNQACHALVDCVRSARSCPDSQELANRLVETIAQALALAEQRLLKGNGNNDRMEQDGGGLVDLDTHSDFILRAADEGMPAFKSSFTFKPAQEARVEQGHLKQGTSSQIPFLDDDYDYQSNIFVNGNGNGARALSLEEVSPPQFLDGNFLDMDMQDFLASCGIEPSLYKLD